ncbi:hypothetical protein MBLNU457_g1077t1 [Dothideomycetes sp. NU457]
MHQTFTGASRRPRQVNLSGRKPNPFATVGQGQGTQQALQSAQQERAARQQQRNQLNAAKSLQKIWRGHRSRTETKNQWRSQWDAGLQTAVDVGAFKSEEESLAAEKMLLLFYSERNEADIGRLLRYGKLRMKETNKSAAHWDLRLARCSLSALRMIAKTNTQTSSSHYTTQAVEDLCRLLSYLVSRQGLTPEFIAESFDVFSIVVQKLTPSEPVLDTIRGMLKDAHPTADVHEGFAAAFLTQPHSSIILERLSPAVDRKALIQGAERGTRTNELDTYKSLWLLAQLVYLVTEADPDSVTRASYTRDTAYISAVSRLLAMVADLVNVAGRVIDMENDEYDNKVLRISAAPTRSKTNSTSRPELGTSSLPLNAFLKRQLDRLVDQDAIRWLLVQSDSQTEDEATRSNELAGYALTLLRVFPRYADDIRMWMYLGPTRTERSVSAVAYFWKQAKETRVFQAICREPKEAIALLTSNNNADTSTSQPPSNQSLNNHADDWRVIMIFFELYTFVLKLMDDEEFLGHAKSEIRMRSNALPLDAVQSLTVFLKNLGFAMYYHAQQISEALNPSRDAASTPSISRHFAGGGVWTEPTLVPSHRPVVVGGIRGMSIDYVKGLVTGLLRAIYERDSRRKFLPKGHWLMTARFDMSNFITQVVAEEEVRHLIEEEDDTEKLVEDEDDGHGDSNTSKMISSQKKRLETVTPRLEILQNMPYIIPFETRVQVFREFVSIDMHKRRHGFSDPDMWRQSIMMRSEDPRQELMRHHAKIRRQHEFEDAYSQFYSMGDKLKEPIQITFVDEFDIVEAGIDGGGVTKEFLTSVTSEAFNPELGLFKTNSQHLLYPNPSKIDSLVADYHLTGADRAAYPLKEAVTGLLQRYEFLGRIVGKCLYEGILIDVGFAGFFLIKWALFGGHNHAAGESGYRANINDLRDLDEELYQGLLTLKNYPGNVEDMGLTFTVTDEVPLYDGRSKAVEHDLIPNGSNTAVTNENRLVYISRMARYRLQTQSQRQTHAFLKGLSTIIQPSWLSMFNQSELQTLIGGAASSIDVQDLRRSTLYGGVYVIGDDQQEHPTIKLFWKVLEGMEDEDRRKLLKFVTSTPRAPLLGFGSLNPKFSIRDAGDDEARIPTTSTCVNLLKLPRYTSEARLRDKLLYAVNSGAGFDLS